MAIEAIYACVHAYRHTIHSIFHHNNYTCIQVCYLNYFTFSKMGGNWIIIKNKNELEDELNSHCIKNTIKLIFNLENEVILSKYQN